MTCQHNPATSRLGRIENLLDPDDIAGNSRHNDPALPVRNGIENLFAFLMHAGYLDTAVRIGRIRQEGQNPLTANFCQTSKICPIVGCCGLVKFEVTCVDDISLIRLDHNPQTLRNGMGGLEEGNDRISKINLRFGIDNMEVIEFLGGRIIFDHQLGQLDGQMGTKDWHLDLFQEIGQGPDGIRMAMAQEDSCHPVLVLHQVIKVGNNDIHTQLLIFWVFEPSIQHKNAVLDLGDVEIFPILPHTAQGHNVNIAHDIFLFLCFFHTNGPCILTVERLTSRITVLQIPAYQTYYTIFSSKKRQMKSPLSWAFSYSKN